MWESRHYGSVDCHAYSCTSTDCLVMWCTCTSECATGSKSLGCLKGCDCSTRSQLTCTHGFPLCMGSLVIDGYHSGPLVTSIPADVNRIRNQPLNLSLYVTSNDSNISGAATTLRWLCQRCTDKRLCSIDKHIAWIFLPCSHSLGTNIHEEQLCLQEYKLAAISR